MKIIAILMFLGFYEFHSLNKAKFKYGKLGLKTLKTEGAQRAWLGPGEDASL